MHKKQVYQIVDCDWNKRNGFREVIGEVFEVAPSYCTVSVMEVDNAASHLKPNQKIWYNWADYKETMYFNVTRANPNNKN